MTMISALNLLKYLFVLTLVIYCQIQLTASLGNNHELNDIDLGDDLYETLPIQHHRLNFQNFRRASLRYEPHILYKKASLRPIIGQNGKVAFTTRDRIRRSLSPLFKYH